MATAFVLYVGDSSFGPSLELLRRVCQPSSRSMPHITVRYPISKALGADDLRLYQEAAIAEIYVAGADSFGLGADNSAADAGSAVVFLRCESPILEALSYKPDFPDSVFHLTVYEGRSSALAHRILSVMREFRWGLNLQMAPTGLTSIEIGNGDRKGEGAEFSLTAPATRVLRQIAGWATEPSFLVTLTDDERVDLIRKVCEGINASHHGAEEHTGVGPVVSVEARDPMPSQPALWAEPDLHDQRQAATTVWSTQRRQRRGRRRSVGLYLTPPELAKDVVTAALTFLDVEAPIDFGDPAIGGGIFFASLLREVNVTRVRSAVGIEVDAARAEQTNLRWRGSPLRVRKGNLFEAELDGTRSLVIANPPYVRFQLLDREESRKWQARIVASVGISVDGRADLYVYFVLFSHSWLAPGAVSAWLLPSQFLQTNYGRSLRDYLTTRVQLLRLHTYDPAISRFENARVSSTVVVFRNDLPDDGSVVNVSVGGPLLEPVEHHTVRVRDLRELPKWTSSALVARERRPPSGVALGALFTVHRGIATGSNANFVLTTDEVQQLGIHADWVKPVIPKSRRLASNVIEANRNGDPLVDPQLWLIDTDTPVESIRRVAPEFAAYLDRVEREVGDRRLLRARHPFYKQERRDAPRFFVGYMGRTGQRHLRSRFFLNRSRAVVLNNYFALYPRPCLSELLDSGVVKDTEVLDALASIDEREIANEGRLYVSGLQKIEPRELERVIVTGLPASVVEAEVRRGGDVPDW